MQQLGKIAAWLLQACRSQAGVPARPLPVPRGATEQITVKQTREAQNQNGHSDRPGQCSPESQHHHGRAHLHPVVEIDRILIGYPDAARGNRTSDVFGLIGTVDARQRVLAASVKI